MGDKERDLYDEIEVILNELEVARLKVERSKKDLINILGKLRMLEAMQ